MASRDSINNRERKYQCKFCPKSFTCSSGLTKHIRVHTGEKPFQCKICQRSFSQLANLKRHCKIHTKDQTFLSSLSNCLQIPASNFEDDDDIVALNSDDFDQQIQTDFDSENICHANSQQNIQVGEMYFNNANHTILVSEENQESISFDQQINRNFSQSSNVSSPKVKLELSTNTSVDSGKCFYNELERKNSSFDVALGESSDDMNLIEIKPDLSILSITNTINKLSPGNSTTSMNTVDGLNGALQLMSSSQDVFTDSKERNYNDSFENVPAESFQYFKSESELYFDNNDFPQTKAANNGFIQDSTSGLKSFNNSQLNYSLPNVPSEIPLVKAYTDPVNSENHAVRRTGSNLDFGQLNISHSLSSENFEVNQNEDLVIGKPIKVDLSHVDCEKEIKVEFQSSSDVDTSTIFNSLTMHKEQRKPEDEQMIQPENSLNQNKVLYLDTQDNQELENSSNITNSFKLRNNSDMISPKCHIENSDMINRDLESSNIILLSPSSSLPSTSQPSSPLPHTNKNNREALNAVHESSISYDVDNGSNDDVVIMHESHLEKTKEKIDKGQRQSEFDTVETIALEDVSEHSSIVIESVFSMNDNDKTELNARQDLSENSPLSSVVVKHLGINDDNQLRNEVEVINLEEMGNDEQHNWSVPLIDIQEITEQKLDAESNFKIQTAEIKCSPSEEANSTGTKVWNISCLETDSHGTLLEASSSYLQSSSNDTKNIPDLPNNGLSPEFFTCSSCKEKFPSKNTLQSHLCTQSEVLHSSKIPYSLHAKGVDKIHCTPHNQSSENDCETPLNSPCLTKSPLSQTEKFTCKYCKKHFLESTLLVKHMETHIEKMECGLCRQPFSPLTNLNTNRKLQFKNKLLHCQFCQRTFPHSFQLLNHLKHHARSIQRSIKFLEEKIRQKQKRKIPLKAAENLSNKPVKLKAPPSRKNLKKKPKCLQLSKKNINQANAKNSLIPVVHLKKSLSEPQFNVISSENDENLNVDNLKEMKRYLIGEKCLNSVKVSGNLASSDSKSSSIEECAKMSGTYGENKSADVNEIAFPFFVKDSEARNKINLDSESFITENNSSQILENSKPEESLQNALLQIQSSELVSQIEYRENLPQKQILPIPSSSPLLQKSHSRERAISSDDNLLQTNPGNWKSGSNSVDAITPTAAVNFDNISLDKNLSEVIFVTSNSTTDMADPSNVFVKSRQFQCNFCNKSFNQKFILIKHLRTHTGEKPYKCEFCPRLFSQLNNLNRHKKSHLPLGLFPCKFCPLRFPSISELNAHNKKLHIGLKPHNCTYCSKRFSSSSVLMAHIRTHTGEKPFVCEVCNRAFSQATNLNRHMKVHVPGRVFRCRYCNHIFKQYWDFRRHLKTHIHFGKMSNEDAFIRKTKRQHSMQQITSRHTKPSKSKDLISKLSETNEHKLRSKIQSLQNKTENLLPKRVTSNYKSANFPNLLKASSVQHCSKSQPYKETHAKITGTPEILAINRPFLQLEMQSVATPVGSVPNFSHESFQPKLSHVSSKDGDNRLHNIVPSRYPFLLTNGQNQRTTNKSSNRLSLINSSESLTKHKLSSRVIAKRNNHSDAFVRSDCKSLIEADKANDVIGSKSSSQSEIELAKNYENNGVGILWRSAHKNQAKTNSMSKDLLIDNYGTVGESLISESVTTLVSPAHPLSVNVKLEPTEQNIEKQSDSTPKNSFKEFPCMYCKKLFHHSQVLCRHLRSHHKSEMTMTSACRLCHATFPNSDALNRHRKTCSQLLLPYFCNLCKEKFPNSSELSRHRQRKHSGGVKRFSCRYCTKVFARNSVLTEHIRTHTGEKPFVCELCLRPFSQATNLKRHQKIHARNGYFVCKYCQASFKQFSLLSRHLRLHSEQKYQENAAEEHQAAVPFHKETETFSKGLNIIENQRSRHSGTRSKTRLLTVKDSAIGDEKSAENIMDNDFNSKTLPNIHHQQEEEEEDQIQNNENENASKVVVLEGNRSQTNFESLNIQEQLQNSFVSSDAQGSNTAQVEQIKTTMEVPGLCYSLMRRNMGENRRDTNEDNLSVSGRTQDFSTSIIPIISPQTHYSEVVSPNCIEGQKEKDYLELSNQPLINMNLSIVKKEGNQSNGCSSGNFITQNPDVKPLTSNIELLQFAPDLITPTERGQDSAINKPYQYPPPTKSSLLTFATQEQQNDRISTHLAKRTKTFTNESNLLNRCKFCNLHFSTLRQLFHHQQLKHPRMKSHQCKYCGRFFARTTVLTEHIRTHTGEKPFVCNVCNRAFSQMTNLKRHQKIHDRKSITCRYCKAIFTDYALLLKHMQSHGKSQEKIPKSFKSVTSTSSEIYARISERIKNMEPKLCRVNTENKRSTRQAKIPLDQNESCLSNPGQGDEQIVASGSTSQSASVSNLDSSFYLQKLQEDKRHNRHLGLPSHQNETTPSPVSTWSWKTDLRSRIKSVPKSVTNKFKEQNVWSNHLVSEGNGQKIMKPKGDQKTGPDHCISPKTNLSKLSRLADFSSDTSQSGSLTDTKDYSCRYCNKSFRHLNDLQTHSTCHSKEKHYKCKYCNRIFGRSSVLKQHIRTHTGEKPFKCDQCLRCFTQSTNLKRHMKLHSGDSQVLKNSDSKKKPHLRTFSHGFHKQLGYYGKSKFRKHNKKSIPLKHFELNSQNHGDGESSHKNLFHPLSNLTNSSKTSSSSSSIIASQSLRKSSSSANTMYKTTVIAPELNSNMDESLIVLSSSRGKKTDTIYVHVNEGNQTKVPLQPGIPAKTTDSNFMPAVEANTETASNKESLPSEGYGSNKNRPIKNPRTDASVLRAEHSKPPKMTHICKICKETFANRWKLSAHFKSHSKRLFQCTFCDKGFTRSSVLREHIRTHTGEKPFKCIHCQRSFSQMTNLKRHLKLHNRQFQSTASV